MPYLNLNHDLEYSWNELLLGMMDIELEDALEHPDCGFPLEVVDCDKPFKESFRANGYREVGWDFGDRRTERVNDMSIFKFIERLLNHNVGKSFDQTYSYFCKKAKPFHKYNRWFFREFEFGVHTWRSGYKVDDEGLIQKTGWNWRRPYYKEDKPVTFYSFDYSQTWRISYGSKNRFFDREETFRFDLPKSYRDRAIFISNTGFRQEFDSKNDPKYKRLFKEDEKRRKKIERKIKREQKEKQYSFLSQSELALIESKKNDEQIKIKHGFDSDSFIGEPYHGRKKKKLCHS